MNPAQYRDLPPQRYYRPWTANCRWRLEFYCRCTVTSCRVAMSTLCSIRSRQMAHFLPFCSAWSLRISPVNRAILVNSSAFTPRTYKSSDFHALSEEFGEANSWSENLRLFFKFFPASAKYLNGAEQMFSVYILCVGFVIALILILRRFFPVEDHHFSRLK